MSKRNYEELSNRILELVGGKGNVSYFTHCISRLRFNLKDRGLVRQEELNKLKGVMGTTWAGDQFQVIIGTEVTDVYNTICEIADLEKEDAIDENLDGVKKGSANPFKVALDMISGSFVPVLPILIACGNVTVVLTLLGYFNLIDTTSSTYQLLVNVANTGFYFMPIFVGAYAAKKLNCMPVLGMLMGAVLIYPQTAELISSGAATIFGLPIRAASYTSTVFPIVVTVFVMSYVEKFLVKISPKSLRTIIEPFGTLLIMLPLELCLLAPLGSIIGKYIIAAIMWIKDTFGFLGVAIYAGMGPIIFLTGMNTAVVSYLVGAFVQTGTEPFLVACACMSNFALLAVTIAIAIKTKDEDVRSKAIATSITNGIGGVSEPALFGVVAPRKYALISNMIGGFCGGIIIGLTSTVAHSFPAGAGLLRFACFIGPEGAGDLINVLIGTAVSMVVGFVLTWITFDKDPANKDEQNANA